MTVEQIKKCVAWLYKGNNFEEEDTICEIIAKLASSANLREMENWAPAKQNHLQIEKSGTTKYSSPLGKR